MKEFLFGFKKIMDETGCYCVIHRWHPFIWIIFLMDLIFGPLVVLFSKTYTIKWYVYELKSILSGKYYWWKNEGEEKC